MGGGRGGLCCALPVLGMNGESEGSGRLLGDVRAAMGCRRWWHAGTLGWWLCVATRGPGVGVDPLSPLGWR